MYVNRLSGGALAIDVPFVADLLVRYFPRFHPCAAWCDRPISRLALASLNMIWQALRYGQASQIAAS